MQGGRHSHTVTLLCEMVHGGCDLQLFGTVHAAPIYIYIYQCHANTIIFYSK